MGPERPGLLKRFFYWIFELDSLIIYPHKVPELSSIPKTPLQM